LIYELQKVDLLKKVILHEYVLQKSVEWYHENGQLKNSQSVSQHDFRSRVVFAAFIELIQALHAPVPKIGDQHAGGGSD
jgi:hypothetical protein